MILWEKTVCVPTEHEANEADKTHEAKQQMVPMMKTIEPNEARSVEPMKHMQEMQTRTYSNAIKSSDANEDE